MSIAERQHYVWRKYLEAWAVDNKVWCCRREAPNKAFNTNPVNLAVERYFYGLTDLTAEDIDFIRRFAIERTTNDELKKLNHGWLESFDALFQLVSLIRTSQHTTPELLAQLAVQLTQFEEANQGHTEQSGLAYLQALINGDSSFYAEPDDASKFCFFLMQQYFRTKRMQDAITRAIPAGLSPDVVRRSWPVLRHIFATNTGFAIYARRETMKLSILQAPDGMEFITCDQPVINTYAAGAPGTIVKDDEFYYPVSPRRAIMMSEHTSYADLHGTTIGDVRMSYLNDLVKRSAHEQTFASVKASLEGVREP